MLKRKPKDVSAIREVARIHEKLGTVLPFAGKGPEALSEIDEAVRMYQQALAANPDDVQAKVDLSAAYEAQGDTVGGAQAINLGRKDEAAAAYRKGLEILPDLPPNHKLAARVARGRILFNMKLADLSAYGNPAAALEKYKEWYAAALEISRANPTDYAARSLAGILLDRVAIEQGYLGDTKGALESYLAGIEPAEQALRCRSDEWEGAIRSDGRVQKSGRPLL